MKTLYLLIVALLLCVSSFAQNTVSDDHSTSESERVAILTPTQINAGDTSIFIPAPGAGKKIRIISICFELQSGNTNYAGTGTDSTFVCSKFCGVRNKLIHIKDTYFTTTNDKPDCASGTFGIDANSPVWIDFASQYITGNKPLKIISKYEIY
jgi:hypothetical protein